MPESKDRYDGDAYVPPEVSDPGRRLGNYVFLPIGIVALLLALITVGGFVAELRAGQGVAFFGAWFIASACTALVSFAMSWLCRRPRFWRSHRTRYGIMLPLGVLVILLGVLWMLGWSVALLRGQRDSFVLCGWVVGVGLIGFGVTLVKAARRIRS
ncbi:MAG: hypothetical protein ACYSU0_05330 [Planctomycetota bacterium]|jgi:hypothetical protein